MAGICFFEGYETVYCRKLDAPKALLSFHRTLLNVIYVKAGWINQINDHLFHRPFNPLRKNDDGMTSWPDAQHTSCISI